MPIQRCKLQNGGAGYKWGQSGHCYPTKAGAEKQAEAAYAHGYVGDAAIKRNITSPTGKDIPLAPIHPNKGIEMAYRRKLRALVAQMQNSVEYWLHARYRQNLPEIAQDGAVHDLKKELTELSRQWLSKFDDGAKDLASWFAQKTKSYSDSSMKKILGDAGISVDFVMNPSMRTTYQSVIEENVGLIKSIPEQYLRQVHGLVMRSVAEGRDLETLTKSLKSRYDISDKRAKLIARDQNNKATSVMTKQRQEDLGLIEAIWRHSTAGKHPRPEHVAADGKKYDIKKGMYLEGEWVWPGTAINCRCVSVPIIPGYND